MGSSVDWGNLAFARLIASLTSANAVEVSKLMSNSVMIVAAPSLENEVTSTIPSMVFSSSSAGFDNKRSESSGEIPSWITVVTTIGTCTSGYISIGIAK